MEQTSYAYTEDETMALITSMCGPLLSKVKLAFKNALKNTKIA